MTGRRWSGLAVLIVLGTALSLHAPGRVGAECVDYRDYMRWVGTEDLRLNYGRDVAISAGHAYVVTDGGGLSVTDLADPISPRHLGVLRVAPRCRAVLVEREHAFVAADDSGLVIVDVSDPESPRRVSRVDTPGLAFDVASSGDYTYVADYAAGLQVIATGDLAAPVLIGSAATPDIARGVAVSGTFAYVADTFAGASGVRRVRPRASTAGRAGGHAGPRLQGDGP
jgi:hypothetical protein